MQHQKSGFLHKVLLKVLLKVLIVNPSCVPIMAATYGVPHSLLGGGACMQTDVFNRLVSGVFLAPVPQPVTVFGAKLISETIGSGRVNLSVS